MSLFPAPALQNLFPSFTPAWIEIDLDALTHNYRIIRDRVGPRTQIFHVVKSNAYGHGLNPVSKHLIEQGADGVCVARLWEAQRLRAAGFEAPILCLTSLFPEEATLAVELDLDVVVFRPEPARALSEAAQAAGRRIGVHLKIDTGMSRLGVSPEDAVAFARFLRTLPGLDVRGLMSHLSNADDEDDAVSRDQIACYDAVAQALHEQNLLPPVRHLANSDGAMRFDEAPRVLVRPGMSTYGCYPSDWYERHYPLRPVMSVRARLISVRHIPKGRGLSYSRQFITRRDSVIGVAPVGYADGYMRAGMGQAQMIVRGRLVPVLGRICMEQSLLDLTDLKEAAYGDSVTVMGRDGDAVLSAETIAQWWGTINYEVVTHLGHQFPKVFLKEGRPVTV